MYWIRLAKAFGIVSGIVAFFAVLIGSMAIADHFFGEAGFLIPLGVIFFLLAVFAIYMGLEDD